MAVQIVDAQIHLWGSGLPSNLSHRQVTAFTPEEAIVLMDEAGIDAAVIHPPGWDPNSTDMAFAAVRHYPGRFAIMGAVPLDRPEFARAHRRLAGATGNARSQVRLSQRSGAAVAARRHPRMAVEGRRRGRRADRCTGNRFAERTRPHRRAPRRAAFDHRSPGRQRRYQHAQRRCGHDPHAGAVSVGQVPQCGGQGDRRTALFERGLSVSALHSYLRQVYDALVRTACSGAPTSPRCPARGANA